MKRLTRVAVVMCVALVMTLPAAADKAKSLWDKRETERRRTADKEAKEAIARSRKS